MSDCSHEEVYIRVDSIERPKNDRLILPMNCNICEEDWSKEIVLDWTMTKERNSDLDCDHGHIMISSFEVYSMVGGADLLIQGRCDDCNSTFYDEYYVCL